MWGGKHSQCNLRMRNSVVCIQFGETLLVLVGNLLDRDVFLCKQSQKWPFLLFQYHLKTTPGKFTYSIHLHIIWWLCWYLAPVFYPLIFVTACLLGCMWCDQPLSMRHSKLKDALYSHHGTAQPAWTYFMLHWQAMVLALLWLPLTVQTALS